MGDRQFGREFVLNVGGLRIATRLLDKTREALDPGVAVRRSALHAQFKITKTVKKEPNTAELTIFNLNEDHRVAMQQRKQETVIEAGYIDNTSVLFRGTLEYSSSTYDGRTWATTLQTSDGTDKLKSSRINKSFKGPVKATVILEAAAKALGVKLGNLKNAIKNGTTRGNLSEFSNGIVLSGKADKVLDTIARSMGYFYSIQDGQLLLLSKKDFLGSRAVVLNKSTGMVGSPEAGEDGFINVRALIQPNLLPAFRVKVESQVANGFYRIERVDFSGITRGRGDWFADLECRPIGGAS